jgi:Short-chain dehydrogenases of various substrate specificities
MKPVVLITGASSGIGKATAQLLLGKNCVVYGAARSVGKMADLVALGGHSVYLDVTDDKATQSCIDLVMAEQGRIDVLVNNAGYGSYGALENVPIEEAKEQMEVNVFGLARITQLVLPVMRKQRSGRIINISSIAGKLTSPLGAWYFASKHAVEGLSDSLRQEVKQFGIDVVIIEPGGTRSEWAHIAARHLVETSTGTPYEAMAKKTAKMFPFVDEDNADPKVIAELISRAITAKHPKTRYIGGTHALDLLTAKRLLSDKLFDDAVLSRLK